MNLWNQNLNGSIILDHLHHMNKLNQDIWVHALVPAKRPYVKLNMMHIWMLEPRSGSSEKSTMQACRLDEGDT